MPRLLLVCPHCGETRSGTYGMRVHLNRVHEFRWEDTLELAEELRVDAVLEWEGRPRGREEAS